MKSYIVTEGRADAELLSRILGAVALPPVHVTDAGGKSSALPLAKSILAGRQSPVALVLDADSLDPVRTSEQERLYSDLMRAASRRVPFRVFLAQPSLERALFDDSATLSRVLGVDIPESMVEEAQFRPQEVLERLIRRSEKVHSRASLPSDIDNEAAGRFAHVPFFRSIIDFVTNPSVVPEIQSVLA